MSLRRSVDLDPIPPLFDPTPRPPSKRPADVAVRKLLIARTLAKALADHSRPKVYRA